VLGREGRLLRWNRHAIELFGLIPEQLLNMQALAVIHLDDRGLIAQKIEEAFDQGQATVESRLLVKDRAVRDYYFSARSIDIEGKGYIIGYGIDITERRLAEEEIRRLNRELEWTVEERTTQLLEAQEDLVRKEKLAILGQLSGSVGHELRNPLGVMKNAIYFLKTVMPGADETLMEYLDIIKHEINNSERIITDLLDFARTKPPGKMAVIVSDLMKESLGRCAVPENVFIQSNIPDKLPPLNVDPLQMKQVFQNLISNAVQAMPEGGQLRISARKVKGTRTEERGNEEKCLTLRTSHLEPDSIEISVADTGVGISPENMKKLFQPLFTTKTKGNGFGLTVCGNLTDANGGRIEVESELGKGTTFTVILPTEG
jgi:PAS domain S-box-containing protein